MSVNSKIEWTDATWNPILGCRKCASGCRNCYAVGQVHRMSRNPNSKIRSPNAGLTKDGNWTGEVRFLPERLSQPLRWREPKAVFVCSLSDPFHPRVKDEWLDRICLSIHTRNRGLDGRGRFRKYPPHQNIFLTKRPWRMSSYFQGLTSGAEAATRRALRSRDDEGSFDCDTFHGFHMSLRLGEIPNNIWLGFSASTQADLDAGAPHLMKLAAAGWKTFLSLEPLCEAIALPMLASGSAPKSVIVGGESGPNARPMHPDWARSIRDQCAAAGVPFMFKQWGEWAPGELASGPITRTERCAWRFNDEWTFGSVTPATIEAHCDDPPDLFRFGKRNLAPLLDGRAHPAVPWGMGGAGETKGVDS